MTPAPSKDPALSADWLGACRRACEGVRAMLGEYPETADREVRTGRRGEGGDMSLVIDRAAEDAIFAEVEALGVGVEAISEERGPVALAGGGEVRVVIDPIDGSLNARRRLPLYSVSVAVASGPSMADVEFAYVYDLGNHEEWSGRRGQGVFLDGVAVPRLEGERPFELLGIESANPKVVAARAQELAATGARRLRAIGSIALSLSFVAAARLDGMLSLYPCRSVDAAAGQMLVTELGGAVAFPDVDDDLARVPLDLEMRSRVLAGANEDLLALLRAATPGDPPERGH